jgi:hypothetical protein
MLKNLREKFFGKTTPKEPSKLILTYNELESSGQLPNIPPPPGAATIIKVKRPEKSFLEI